MILVLIIYLNSVSYLEYLCELVRNNRLSSEHSPEGEHESDAPGRGTGAGLAQASAVTAARRLIEIRLLYGAL